MRGLTLILALAAACLLGHASAFQGGLRALDLAPQPLWKKAVGRLSRDTAPLKITTRRSEGHSRATLRMQTQKDPQNNDAVAVEEPKENFLEGIQATWKEMMDPPFDDDESLAAMACKYRIEIIEETGKILKDPSTNSSMKEWALKERREATKELVPSLDDMEPGFILLYWRVRWERMIRSPRLKKALPSLVGALNFTFILVFLRFTLPRLLAMQSTGDLGEFGNFLGLPGKEELLGYITYAENLPFWEKFTAFTGIFVVEKMLLIGEIIPVGVVLPTISPILFGGVATGSAVTAFSSTLASSANFVIGRELLTEQVKNFTVFPGQPPIGDSAWFNAIYRRFDSSQFPDSFVPEGFKMTLLMRLAPLLPIPTDAHWYVAGTTPVKFWEFFAAHFIGTFKVAILDAYFGSLLLSSVVDSAETQAASRNALIGETIVIIVVSVILTNVATGLFTTILTQEGVDAMSMGMSPDGGANAKKDSSEGSSSATANSEGENSIIDAWGQGKAQEATGGIKKKDKM